MTQNLSPREAFAAAMALLAETYSRQLTPGATEGYWLALQDLTPEELAMAAKLALQESHFMPTPAELREFAGKGGKLALTTEMAKAWEAVRTAMDRYDYTHSVDFGPLVNAIVRNLGGWYALCDKSIPDLVWVRKDFERLYEAYKAKPPESLNGGYLSGAFGGEIARVPIDGKLPVPQITSGEEAEIRRIVRRLADDKSNPGPS